MLRYKQTSAVMHREHVTKHDSSISQTCIKASLWRHCSSQALHFVSSSAKSRFNNSSCYHQYSDTTLFITTIQQNIPGGAIKTSRTFARHYAIQ